MTRSAMAWLLAGTVLILLVGCGERSVLLVDASRGDALVIAHRGASGIRPEHTMQAYGLAYAQGADLLEPDVVMLKSGELLCSHDLTLESHSDVAARFPGRARDDGKYYACDFTLGEVRRLRRTDLPDGAPADLTYRYMTFDEMVRLVRQLNRETGRSVGIIPEPKKPAFHMEQGLDIAAELAHRLRAHGYTRPKDGAIVQCFDLETLRRLREDLGVDLPLVYLVGADGIDQRTLRSIASWVDGIGPSRRAIEPEDGSGPTDLIERAHRLGLAVYPYTFKREPEAMARFFGELGVDGLFTDYTDAGVAARSAASGGE